MKKGRTKNIQPRSQHVGVKLQTRQKKIPRPPRPRYAKSDIIITTTRKKLRHEGTRIFIPDVEKKNIGFANPAGCDLAPFRAKVQTRAEGEYQGSSAIIFARIWRAVEAQRCTCALYKCSSAKVPSFFTVENCVLKLNLTLDPRLDRRYNIRDNIG